MKRFILKNLMLLSTKERRAKKIVFDPQRTIIFGKNSTGKSCLLKTIVSTFGATPPKVHRNWKDADVTSLVRFSVDSINYSILKSGPLFSIFDSKLNLIDKFSSITNGIGPFLAEIFDFKIKLNDRKFNLITPPPAYLFLPYYVDQDAGWKNSWESFVSLSQLKDWRRPIIAYHTGLKPNKFYEFKGEIETINEKIKELDQERNVLKGLLNNLNDKINKTDFNIDIEEFKNEITELLVECKKLNKIEVKLKERLVELNNFRINLESQIKITEKTQNELSKDYTFANDSNEHSISCPICGAEYSNSFEERFQIAKDEERCYELLIELKKELIEIETEINNENIKYKNTIEEIEKINQILNVKKGDIQLKSIIESEGKRELKVTFDTKMNEIQNMLGENLAKIHNLNEKLKLIEDKERKKLIINDYAQLMSNYRLKLDVMGLDEKYLTNIYCKINESGSALPRALLAYYFSILNLAQKYSSSVFCPIIIDSPNQQAQDEDNRQKLLSFIKENQPEGSQIILGLEDEFDIDFNCKRVVLDEKYHLLQEEEYSEVMAYLFPLLELTTEK